MNTTPEDEEIHDFRYYKDIARCFVPSCGKYRRDCPNIKFLSVPESLKAIWCLSLDMNCPKRLLYVCEDHINIEEDCYSRGSRLLIKQTANLMISKTCYQEEGVSKPEETMPSSYENTCVLQTERAESSKKCAAVQSVQTDEIKKCNISTMHKPSSRNVAVGTNIKWQYVDNRIMPTQPQTDSATTSFSSSTTTMYEPSTSSHSSSHYVLERDLTGRDHILKLIQNHPKMYIGIPKDFYWLVDYLSKQCKLNKLNVIITLFKIKLNDSLKRISHQFDLHVSTIERIIFKSLPILASYLQNFIFLPTPTQIKHTLPPVFKIRFSNVQAIIDCFEIQIEKPADPLRQAQTWSQYKSCNTIKYLIACCPNGFICFISKGFGGRISDKAITEHSGFLDILPSNAVILADRGFKGLEVLFRENGVQLLRPPSVMSNEKPSKKEVITSKVIASLRVHVERVIRRVREFSLLKPHSVVHHKHLFYLDECVVLACALINLQGGIIKTL